MSNTSNTKKGYVRALYGYDAKTDQELSFDEREIITVLNKFEGQNEYEGWWYGRIDDYFGMFPVSYTEPHFKEQKKKKVAVDSSKATDWIKKLQAECGFLSSDKLVNALNEEFDDLSKALNEEKERKQREAETNQIVNTSVMDANIILNLQKEMEIIKQRLQLFENENTNLLKEKVAKMKKTD